MNNENLHGMIFGIQRFSVDDGPGIRTTVFLKGCNMSCTWCHNPESLHGGREIMFQEAKCSLCGACAEACPQHAHLVRDGIHVFDRSLCVGCGRCVPACISGTLVLSGTETTPAGIVAQALRDMRYYKASGGGLTISGGEPMCQLPFTLATAKLAAREKIGVAIETNGSAPFSGYCGLIPYTDLFLVDYKLTDEALHLRHTGVSGRPVRETIQKLDEAGAKIVLRCPIIPQLNDNDTHFRAIAALTAGHKNILGFELMPYHNMGLSKARRLNTVMPEFSTPKRETVDSWRNRILAFGGKEWSGAYE